MKRVNRFLVPAEAMVKELDLYLSVAKIVRDHLQAIPSLAGQKEFWLFTALLEETGNVRLRASAQRLRTSLASHLLEYDFDEPGSWDRRVVQRW